MIPLALDPKNSQLVLIGAGPGALRRLRALHQAGATGLLVFSPDADAGLAQAAGAHLRHRLPDTADLQNLHLVWVVGLPTDTAAKIAAMARSMGALVNVEDVPALCDFHSVAEIRRGDLLLSISTNGAAPGLAASIRRRLERCFSPQWAARVAEIAALRRGWQTEGVTMAQAAQRIDAMVAEHGWLPCPAAEELSSNQADIP